MAENEKIVVMGGTFNPPTLAHLRIIQVAMDAVGASRGYLVPVSFACLKRKMARSAAGRVCFSDAQRQEMLEALCREDRRLAVSRLELHEIQALTYKTMSAISQMHPGARCLFLAGDDKLELLAQWGRSSDFFRRFGAILFCRNGVDTQARLHDTEGLAEHSGSILLLPQPEGLEGISSTAVRQRILDGASAAEYVCPAVWDMLKNLNAGDFPEEIQRFRGEYGFLDNSHPCPVLWEGISYPCAESAFQASKTDDQHIRESFAKADPEKARQKGAKLQPKPCWEAGKLGIMKDILLAKFLQNPDLMEKLVATGDAVLTAGCHGGDLYWGVDLYSRVGENRLGFALMEARDRLRAGHKERA